MTDDIRVDLLTGTPVIMVPARQSRPNLPVEGCPFCVGGLEAPEPYDVRAFTNRWPSLSNGRAEVVLFSPDHHQSLGTMPVDHLARVIELWTLRTEALGSRADVAYVLVFENRGAEVGATISHPHGQIYAFSEIPPLPARELSLAAERDGCALCAEEPGDRAVTEVGSWRAWIPHASPHPYGLVLAPAAHVGSLPDLEAADRHDLASALHQTLRGLDAFFAEETPYMLWIHQRPTDGAPWRWAHLHLEIMPFRRARGVNRYVAGAELGSGTLLNSVDPIDAARALRPFCDPEGTT